MMVRQQDTNTVNKTMKMKLSIIVPVYNGEKYIREGINALLNQDLAVADYELIVVNDGSTDGTLEILEEIKRKNAHVQLFSQENKGLSVTRNVGLEMAKGEYILFVDADDLIANHSLKTILDYTIQYDLDFLGFGYRHITTRNPDVNFDPDLKIIYQGAGNGLIEQLHYWNGCCWYIYKKSKAENLRFIPNIFVEDAPFTPRLILSMDKCVVIQNEVYLYYRNNTGSITKKKSFANHKKMFEDMFFGAESFDKLFDEFPLTQASLHRLRTRQESFLYFGIIRFMRLHANISMVNDALMRLQFDGYKAYPIKTFKGYNKQDKLLLFIINHKFLLWSLNFINSKLKVIR